MSVLEPVKFVNNNKQTLFGILHKPHEIHKSRLGVIILSPGVKSRVAPHRLYVKLAKIFEQNGFPVLRFDFYGLGDSEGSLTELFLPDLYTSIQKGRYIDDTLSAMNWMEKNCDVDGFILVGLCGGAITGLFAGEVDKRVKALIGIGIPVILDLAKEKKSQTLTSGELQLHRKLYFKKILNPKSIIRLLTLQSDYKVIINSVFGPLTSKFKNKPKIKDLSNKEQLLKQDKNMVNFNFLFPKAFIKMLKDHQKIALFFGAEDRLYWEYKEKFYANYSDAFEQNKDNYEIYLSDEARHIFELREHQKDLFTKISSWLAANV
jgi:hypothetical protein